MTAGGAVGGVVGSPGKTDAAARRAELRAAIDRLPRATLGTLPTPLDDAPRLRRAGRAEHPDTRKLDWTGLWRNKTRKLGFNMGEALERGVDVVVGNGSGAPPLRRGSAAPSYG